jgi:cystathionine beta-lyase/cystathionine gamma-synthase
MEPHIESDAVHAGREDFRELGVHAPPLDFSSTYPIDSLASGSADLDAYASGAARGQSSLYARLHNPTVDRWERAVAQLEHAEQAVAYASGMAAITATLMACRLRDQEEGRPRTHVVGVRPLYGGTDHLLASGLLGYEVRWTDADGIAETVDADTALVIAETPSNPTLVLLDIAAAAQAAGDVPLLIDNTFATPILQNPLDLGASFALHSATKFLGGHGDVLAGVVATDSAWAARLRKIRIATGAVLHPMAAFLLHRSLPTLPMRVERAQQTAIELTARLQEHPAVTRVLHPGSSDPRHLVGTQMRGPGSVFSIELAGGIAAAACIMQSVQMLTPAVSLGSTDTLIQHPAGLTHRIVGEGGRKAGGVHDGLLRIPCGLEHVEDLWQDLAQALDRGSSA